MTDGGDHMLNRPPKSQGFPAIVIYCPQWETAFQQLPDTAPPVNTRIQVEFSDCHWYQDM
jgi:hypothetical protein